MLLKPLIALLQFTTVLPLGRMQDFSCFARRSYLYPIAGYVVGGISALAVYFIGEPLVAAAIGIALLFLLTGCNHLDGLLDFGDGLMAHGDRDARIRALTDRQIGTGGMAMGVSVTLISFAALSSSPCLACSLIAGEVGAKFSMAFLSTHGLPFREGIHATIQSRSRPYFPVLAAVLCIPLALLPFRPLALGLAAAAMVLCPLVLLTLSERLFGGVNGDVVGAGNEITRACVMVVLALG
jgi:adenosylcobinamide-GDP ribazoletransferase